MRGLDRRQNFGLIPFVLLAIVASILLGCATVRNEVITPEVHFPEVASEKSLKMSSRLLTQYFQTFETTGTVNSRPYVPVRYQQPELNSAVAIDGSATLSRGFELSFQPISSWISHSLNSTSGYRITGKYQFMGAPTDQFQMGWKGLLFFARFSSQSHTSGNQKDLFGPGGYPWNATAKAEGFEGGLSLGYRWRTSWLVYGGLASQSFQLSGDINQERSVTGDYPAQRFELPKESGNQYVASIGLEFGRFHSVSLKHSMYRIQWGQGEQDRSKSTLQVTYRLFSPGEFQQILKPNPGN